MDMHKLTGLTPEPVFSYFEQLCAIPHGSGNTKMISDFLVAFAQDLGLRYVQDEHNNVIIFKDGSKGYEDHPTVILQGHIDMVAEKDADCPINMQTEGLDITHDGEYVFANGTTLGGDNGIAVAFAMALLADKNAVHPPLEVLLTVDEEIGMLGADAADLSMLKGRTLINVDSEEEGIFTVSCAGGVSTVTMLPVQRHAVYGPCIRLSVDGLQGGHSGVEIHKNRANANKVMGELLSRVQKVMPLCLTSFSGGSKDNAIPRSCTVTAVMLGMDPAPINEIIETLQQEIRTQFDEPDAVITGENVEALGGNALSTEDTAKVTAMLCAVPNGVQEMSKDIPGLVQTSLNLGIVKLGEGFEMVISVRSSVNAEKLALVERLEQLAKFQDAAFSCNGDYPAWEYKEDSRLRDTVVDVYRRMFQKEPEVVAIHAGLECGLLSEKLSGLDCISMGPDMYDIHTSRERLSIASTQRTWKFLQQILKEL